MNQQDKGQRDRTSTALKRLFSDYYRKNRLELPPRFTRREWGFILFDRSGMVRHRAFNRRSSLTGFRSGTGIRHAYHSVAYYDRPDAPRMKGKGWRGADLVFDLDADHLEGGDALSYGKSLELVKKEFLKLVRNFIMDDFGIDPDDLVIVFSGGRGYHLHVHSAGIEKLGSPGRREIVDYITGQGVDFDGFIRSEAFDAVKVTASRSVAKKRYEMPSPREGGWKGKLARGVIDEARSLEAIEYEGGMDAFIHDFSGRCRGIGPKKAEKVWTDLFPGKRRARTIDRIIDTGEIDVFSSDGNRNTFLKYVKERLSVELAGETDEPVTTDIHRLIRLAGSLHGKTGFRAMTVTLDELEDFDPLVDAIAFDDLPVKIRGTAAAQPVRLAGEEYEVEEGKSTELPCFAAVYFMCRGSAEFIKIVK